MPEVTVPEVTVPEVTVPEVTVPEVTMPEVTFSMRHFLFIIACCIGQPLVLASDLVREDLTFMSQGVQLAGSLVLPKTGSIHSAVVFVHGSGKQVRNLYLAEQFANAGVAALVYDKRGVGQSAGHYEARQSVSEKNIIQLADDALAAFAVLKSHPRTQESKLGLAGISQAGWIIPLAAEKDSAVEFMVIWSGPVCKVSEEDIFSRYTADRDGKKIPAFEQALAAQKRPYVWPKFLGKDSDPSDSLINLNIPGLWLFGKQDGSVPVDLSMQRLDKLMESGKPYQYVLFSDLGHNNMPQTFRLATDWLARLSKL